MRKWYRLDNVGKFYASISNTGVPKVFRYSAYLIDEVDPIVLQQSLNKTIEIYPSFNVNLKKGFYWYYLDENNKKVKVSGENLPICFKLYKNSDDFLFRVIYFKNKINFEVSHILSDGRGSVEFFKLLLTNYIAIKYNINIEINKNNKSQLEKSEDSFSKYYKKTKLPKRDNVVPYLYKGRKYRNQTRFFECFLNSKEVLDLAHKYNSTLTAFLVSVLIYSYKDVLKVSDLNKTIRIDLPVDLRRYFNSYSSMNFFGLTTILYKYRSKEDTLEEIIDSVNKQFKENINAKKLSERANLMVSFEKNIFCRFIPIFIKDVVLKIINQFTYRSSTTCLSNIGIIKLDNDIEDMIDRISVIVSTDNYQFTICTFKNKLCIGISNKFVNNDIIKNFCRYFSLNNIDVVADVNEVE